MENNAASHGSAPNDVQYNQAITELDAALAKLEVIMSDKKIATRDSYGEALAEFG